VNKQGTTAGVGAAAGVGVHVPNGQVDAPDVGGAVGGAGVGGVSPQPLQVVAPPPGVAVGGGGAGVEESHVPAAGFHVVPGGHPALG